jgi:TonB family protein
MRNIKWHRFVTAGLFALHGHTALSQAIPSVASSDVETYSCPVVPFLPHPTERIIGVDLRNFWLEPKLDKVTLTIPPNTLKGGSVAMVRYDFLIDALGCPSGHRVMESSGFPAIDEQVLELLTKLRYLPAENNLDRRPVEVTGNLFGFGVPQDETRYGNLRGSIGDLDIDLEGAYGSLKANRHSEQCYLSISTVPMDRFSVHLSVRLPCQPLDALVGTQYHPDETGVEYTLNVSTSFEFDEDGNGGRYATQWESSSFQQNASRMMLRITAFDGRYLSGEVRATLPTLMRDGVMSNNGDAVPLTATFRARMD